MSTNELESAIVSAQEGREEGYRQLFAEFSGMVFGLVSRMLADEAEAEELTQDVFMQAFAALAGFRSQGSGFSAWIRRIAYNMAMSKLRQKRPQLISLDEPEYATYADHAGVADEGESAEESIGNLIAAIGHLRQEEQALLQLCYYDGLSMQDIAYITSLTPQAVAMRLSRIRKKLKNQLSKHS